mgnify:CR=1 FL=1
MPYLSWYWEKCKNIDEVLTGDSYDEKSICEELNITFDDVKKYKINWDAINKTIPTAEKHKIFKWLSK